MAQRQFTSAIQFISQLLRRRHPPELTDGLLLERFVSRRDEASFSALVQRHGPMVLGVCRQVLRDATAAEDAFQATFLVLARKAGSIRRGQAVAGWLYRVAHRLALHARSQDHQRRQCERQIAMMRQAPSMAAADDQDLWSVLHEEVQRLPEKFQAPVVLCYLQGLTSNRVAEELGCRESTVRGRLFQARELLRSRLARRGIALSVGCLGTALAEQTSVALPAALADNTIRGALAFGAGRAVFAGTVSVQGLALAEGMVRAVAHTRLTLAVLVCLLVGGVGIGAGALAWRSSTGLAAVVGAEALAEPAPGAEAIGQACLDLHVAANGKVSVLGRTEPLATADEVEAYLQRQYRAAAKAIRDGGDPRASVPTTVRVSADPTADFGSVKTVLGFARKAGYTKLQLPPFAQPVGPAFAGQRLTLHVTSQPDGSNTIVTCVESSETQLVPPDFAELRKLLKSLRAEAANEQDINFDPGDDVRYQYVETALKTIARAGFQRVNLDLPPGDIVEAIAPPPMDDRPIDEIAKMPRPEGVNEQAKETSVAAGLAWIVAHQAEDGHFSLDAFHADGKCRCGGRGGRHDVAGTSFGVLPFLRAGQTPQKGGHAKSIERALKWLITRQGADGSLGSDGYEQALATLCLCEAYGHTLAPELKAPAQRAIDCCVAWQHEAGGFRYRPRMAGDLSVGAWFCQALTTGARAGLKVPDTTWTRWNRFLDSVGTPDGSLYGYTGPNPSPNMTAAGLLCRTYFLDDPLLAGKVQLAGLKKGAEYLHKLPPSDNFRNSCYYYNATMFMNQDAVDGADQWNAQMRGVLIGKQDWGTTAGHLHEKGSWSPDGDAWGGQIGRLGMTSVALLTLLAPDSARVAASTGPPKELTAAELQQLWSDLGGGEGPFRAARAVRALAAAPVQAIPHLKEKLRPVATADPKLTAQWIADLDSPKFETRQRATGELEKLGEPAVPALRQVLEGKPALEVRQRVEALLTRLADLPLSAEQQQGVRAVRVLERAGSPEARQVLETLIGGARGARLTEAARAALDRLAGR